MRLLILGGTGEARELAAQLVDLVEVTSSLAGRVSQPGLPVGKVRIGGFGGIPGLREALQEYDAVVDATHPFARGMSANATTACLLEDVPLLRLERPGWPPHPAWRYVDTPEEAAIAAGQGGTRPFLSVGRQELALFIPALSACDVLARVVDAPADPMPQHWTIIHSRGPYTLDGERALLRRHSIDVLVTKDSGGSYTWPKMEAARELNLSVVVIRRPAHTDDVPVVHTTRAAVNWVISHCPQGQ